VGSPQFDIFERRQTELRWVEAAHDLASAKRRIEELASANRCEYVVFDQRAKRIVAVSG
jgi:hypothetical protein